MPQNCASSSNVGGDDSMLWQRSGPVLFAPGLQQQQNQQEEQLEKLKEQDASEVAGTGLWLPVALLLVVQ